MKPKKRIGIFCSSNPLLRSPKPTDYQYLIEKGLDIFEHPQVRKRWGHTAGTIKERVDAIHSLLQNDEVDILMAYWGGANTNQILPYLDYNLFSKYPKPIIGFSDTSALLLAVNKLSGIKTYMGPSGVTFDKPDPFTYSFDYFEKLVINQDNEVIIEDSPNFADDLYFLRPDSNHRIIQNNTKRKVYNHGLAKGKVIASNLQTLLVLTGTKYFPELEGKVLFIEEAESEDPSMIHRFFTQLSQVINLNDLAAICIGKFASQSQFDEKDSEEMIYDDIFKNVNIPIIYNLNFGHTDPLFTIPIGGKAIIDTKENIIKFTK